MPTTANKRTYQYFVPLPVFGKIPLHPCDIIADLKIRENPPLWAQFFKYGICGILSLLLTYCVVFYVQYKWPAYLDAKTLGTAQMQKNMTVVLVSAFIPVNFFAYMTNRFFVFTPGKYSLMRELVIFTLVSALSLAGGEIGKRIIIHYGYGAGIATAAFAISSAVVNFLARKFIIFKN